MGNCFLEETWIPVLRSDWLVSDLLCTADVICLWWETELVSGEIFSKVKFSDIACLFTVSIGSALWVGVFILFSTAEELTDMDCLVLVLVALYTILLLLEKADIILLLEVYIEQVISRSSLFFSNNQSCIGESVLLEICSL